MESKRNRSNREADPESKWMRIKHKVKKWGSKLVQITPPKWRMTSSQREDYECAQGNGLNVIIYDKERCFRPKMSWDFIKLEEELQSDELLGDGCSSCHSNDESNDISITEDSNEEESQELTEDCVITLESTPENGHTNDILSNQELESDLSLIRQEKGAEPLSSETTKTSDKQTTRVVTTTIEKATQECEVGEAFGGVDPNRDNQIEEVCKDIMETILRDVEGEHTAALCSSNQGFVPSSVTTLTESRSSSYDTDSTETDSVSGDPMAALGSSSSESTIISVTESSTSVCNHNVSYISVRGDCKAALWSSSSSTISVSVSEGISYDEDWSQYTDSEEGSVISLYSDESKDILESESSNHWSVDDWSDTSVISLYSLSDDESLFEDMDDNNSTISRFDDKWPFDDSNDGSVISIDTLTDSEEQNDKSERNSLTDDDQSITDLFNDQKDVDPSEQVTTNSYESVEINDNESEDPSHPRLDIQSLKNELSDGIRHILWALTEVERLFPQMSVRVDGDHLNALLEEFYLAINEDSTWDYFVKGGQLMSTAFQYFSDIWDSLPDHIQQIGNLLNWFQMVVDQCKSRYELIFSGLSQIEESQEIPDSSSTDLEHPSPSEQYL